jgi:hypothetical protein
MANTITYLKNHQRFAWKVRIITANTYLEKLMRTIDDEEKKVMVLRITEELISSTEDLAMWIGAIQTCGNPTKVYKDIWEYMLLGRATNKQIVDILKDTARARTPNGLIKKLKLAPIEKIAISANMSKEDIKAILSNVLAAVKASQSNRTVRRGVLLRFHNKVKHGMLVQDYGHELYIRDLMLGKNGRKKNRNLYLDLDIEKSRKMFGTIEANGYAIKSIISLIFYAIIEQIKSKNKKMTKKQKKFWLEALNA